MLIVTARTPARTNACRTDDALARGVLGRPGVGTRQNEHGPEERIAGRLARAPLDHVPVGGQLQDARMADAEHAVLGRGGPLVRRRRPSEILQSFAGMADDACGGRHAWPVPRNPAVPGAGDRGFEWCGLGDLHCFARGDILSRVLGRVSISKTCRNLRWRSVEIWIADEHGDPEILRLLCRRTRQGYRCTAR